MPSLELSKLQAVSGPRALSEADRTAPKAPGNTKGAQGVGSGSADGGVSLEIGNTVDSAKAPIDSDRVAQIRDALRDGSYPLVPTKIADAMIAAQYSFEVQK